MLVQLARLVVGGFEDGCTTHRSLRGSDDSEVFACDAEQDLPVQDVSSELCGELAYGKVIDVHIC